ncbi:hypothetical protein FHL15_009182 [Xylaria flabelliformis]|uniref:Short-chain dehydrogenase/reductase family protein n=1 Tax=Xylaria flabelliformis TaxID=2512241 RepID=A0A553HPP9_9PEZI|nr:hypothetical protein FHL15_009182 [Xylaria flabelliformis]
MSRSFDLGPPTESPGMLFLNSQFRSPVQWPPKDTRIDGKVAIITGSNSGLGFESARQLLAMGLSCLILAVRSADKGQKAAAKLGEQYPEANIQVWLLDMESYESINTFANRANAELSRLDIVILNAGVQLPYFTTNSHTKHENSIQVNYLSTMLLAILMLPILKAKRTGEQPGRLTIVSSGTARGSTLSEPAGTPILAALDDSSRPWRPVARYAVSKMLAHLFILELVQRVKVDDGVIVNLVDPGLVGSTNLQGRAPGPVVAFFYLYKAILARSLAVGGSTYVDAVVVKGAESHGCYIANWKISSYAAFLYTPEGEAARKQLWEETMDEFDFVDARGILAALTN